MESSLWWLIIFISERDLMTWLWPNRDLIHHSAGRALIREDTGQKSIGIKDYEFCALLNRSRTHDTQ